jgi:predicted acetyltransferase
MNHHGCLDVLPATREQLPVIANLLELYVHDFSEFHPIELGPDGRFGYRDLPLYWSEPERHPFLISFEGNPAGFVFVRQGSQISHDPKVWYMTEFFVVRGYRRRQIGTEIARRIWQRFPGQWEVRVMESNRAGHKFWQHAISEFAGATMHSTRVEKAAKVWNVFAFESPQS